MTRSTVFKARLAATLAALLLAFGVVRLLWYPGAYFALSGAGKLYLTLAAVLVVAGPGLATLMYRPGKWGLRFDMVAIAVLELAILGWGLAEIHARRPEFAVFVVDRFEAVTRSEVDTTPLGDSRLARRPVHQPRLVHAALPADPQALTRLIDETVFGGKADIDRRPEFWQPYPTGIRQLRSKAKPLSRFLAAADRRRQTVADWLQRNDAAAEKYVYLPIQARAGNGIVIVDPAIGYPVDVIVVDPWKPIAADSAAQDGPPARDIQQAH